MRNFKMKKSDRDKLIAKVGEEEAKKIIKDQKRRELERINSDPDRLERKRLQSSEYAKRKRSLGNVVKNPDWLKKHIDSDPVRYCYMNLLAGYRRSDNDNNREYNLTIEWVLENIAGKECTYCGAPSTKECPTGIDRKDSSLGHLKENCVACCKPCNSLKGARFSFETMIIIGDKLRKIRPEFRKRAYDYVREYAKMMVKLSKKGVILKVEDIKFDN